MTDPDWWADFTVWEARLLGNLLLRKAKELERELKESPPHAT